jgi:hypothetical protein
MEEGNREDKLAHQNAAKGIRSADTQKRRVPAARAKFIIHACDARGNE